MTNTINEIRRGADPGDLPHNLTETFYWSSFIEKLVICTRKFGKKYLGEKGVSKNILKNRPALFQPLTQQNRYLV